MGCNIQVTCERKRKNGGEWETIEWRDPFEYQNYDLFALFANVRNYSGIRPISEPRGYPDDSPRSKFEHEYDEHHSASWLSMDELKAINPDSMVEDRRSHNNGDPLPAGTGEIMTMKEFLGDLFFEDVEKCMRNGVDRIVFDFKG